MKRHPTLVPLARDHHSALVFARWAAQFPADECWPADSETATRIAQARSHLLQHFLEEEALLCPRLEALGMTGALQRLHTEHAALRALLDQADHAEPLHALGQLLSAHTRWEDRDLFPALELRWDAA